MENEKTFCTYYIYTNVLVTSGNPQTREEGPTGRVDYRCDPVNDFFFNGFFKCSYEIQFRRFFGPY